MNHLLRDARADHRRRLGGDRGRGQPDAASPTSRRASSSTSPGRTAGSTRRWTSAASAASTSPGRGLRASSARCSRSSSCAPDFTVVARRARRDLDRGASRPRPRLGARRRGARIGRGREHRGVPRLRRGRDRRASSEASPHARRSRAGTTSPTTRGTSPRRSRRCCAAGVERPVRPRARARAATRASSRRPSTAATRARPPARDPRRPDRLGARRSRRGRAEPARRRLPVRVAARTCRSATTHHDADSVHLYIEESFTFRVPRPRPRWC